MIQELLDLSNFRKYAQYLLSHHVDQLVELDIKRSFELKLPILKLFENLSKEELFTLSKKGIEEYLLQITQDKVVESVHKSMSDWKADKIAVPREKLVASDIALIYNVRKHSLLSLLPRYTSDIALIIKIVKEIEDFYSFQEEIAIQTFAEIKNEVIDKNEKRLKEAQISARLGYWDYDVEKNEVQWSDELYLLYGFNPEIKITPEVISRQLVKEDIAPLAEKVRKIYHEGGSFTHEYRIHTMDGSFRYLYDHAYIESNFNGRKIVKGISQDITERKLVEQELLQRELQLNEAQSIAHLGSWEWDTLKNIVSWSDELYRLYGYEPHEIAIDYEVYLQHVAEEDRNLVMEFVNECFVNHRSYTFEHRIVKKDGTQKWLLSKGKVSAFEGTQVLKLAGIAMDITDQKLKDQKLQYREEQLLEAQSIAQVGSFNLDLITYQLEWTIELYNIFGLSPQKGITYKKYENIIHQEDLQNVRDKIQFSISNKQELNIEYRIVTEKGSEKTVWVKGKAYYNAAGKPVKLIGTTADITSRKKLEKELKESEAKFRLLAEHSSDVISTHDTTLDYLYISPSSLTTYGYLPEEMISKGYFDFIHSADVTKIKESFSTVLEKSEGITLTYRFKKKDGSYIWIESVVKGIATTHSDSFSELHIASRDVTKRKQVEQDLEMKQIALKASNKELEAFSYTISHDLRSPLRAIDGFGRRLAQQYEASLDTEGKRLLDIVRKSAQKMGLLIDSLLDFSRLNRKDIRKYSFNTLHLVQQVVQQCKEENPDCNPEIIIHKMVDAPADKDLVYQVWHNLISNAIKFSAKSLKPVIEIGSEVKINENIYFVKDNGAGFQMEYKDKLFGVFQRLHTAEEFEGTGVGLATVQRIIHRHMGAVWAEGTPGKGATFYFSIPTKHELEKI